MLRVNMATLMFFSLILSSDHAYKSFFEKRLNEMIYLNDSIDNWKHKEIYRCPMQYEVEKLVIIDSETALVEQSAKY